MSAADSAWGNRPETKLSAAVLEIDPNRAPPAGGFDPSDTGGYNPSAAEAPVKVFTSGIRNAYDLVWHSNGKPYVPTYSSAAGGNVPDDPGTPANEVVNDVSKQDDYLFRVEGGGYYGHPNPTRGEYVMNGGNPTGGTDKNEVVAKGKKNGHAVGVQPEENYRIDSAYSLGENRSPNGAVEYKSDVFGASLKGAVLFTECSGGDDARAVLLD